MKHCKGSSLLMVILITALVMIVISGGWRATHYTRRAVQSGAQIQQRRCALEGLLVFAAKMVTNNWDIFMRQSPEKYVYAIQAWPFLEGTVPGTIEVGVEPDRITIHAALLFDRHGMPGMQASFERIGEDIVCREWKMA